MKKYIIAVLGISLLLAPMAGLCRPSSPGFHRLPRRGPPPPSRHIPPPPRHAPHPRHFPPPRHCGGLWFSAGGLTCLSGTIIGISPVPPSTTTIVYAQPQTVVVQPSASTVSQANALKVESASDLTKDKLKKDICENLAQRLKNIPYSVEVGDFYTVGANFSASITVIVSIGGNNYSITSGGIKDSYENLKAYLTDEIVNAAGKLANKESTTFRQIS